MRSAAPTGGQASGRRTGLERRAARRDENDRDAVNCSIACEVAGSGNVGAVATNELPSNDMVAQTAQ